MAKLFAKSLLAILCMMAVSPASAQFSLGKAIKGAGKVVQAATLTDDQMTAYVKEYIDWMDTHNPVTKEDNPYTQRLMKLTEGLTSVEGLPLNFKV